MDPLRKSLREYLEMRRGLGFKLERSGRWLEDFISFIEQHHARHISCTLALSWAQQAKKAQPMYRAQRLSAVRGFACYLSAFDPRTEIPPADLLPYRRQRRTPYLYTDEELQRLLKLDLTRFSGHITVTQRGVQNVEARQEIYEGISLPDGTAGAIWPRDSGAFQGVWGFGLVD